MSRASVPALPPSESHAFHTCPVLTHDASETCALAAIQVDPGKFMAVDEFVEKVMGALLESVPYKV